jgi:hypothetical protein
MMACISILVAVEDALSEAVIRKIIQCSDKNYLISRCLCRGGFGYLKKMINGFNNAAKTAPVLVLTDVGICNIKK